MAQIALNNNKSETTNETPFYANFGKHPNLFMEPKSGPQTDKAMLATKNLKDVHEATQKGIAQSQLSLSRSRHKVTKKAPQLKEGDKVYLLTKNLKTKRKTKKLDHVKVGPFLIAERKGPTNYRLELPKDARIHPVFHISMLEPADPDTTLQTTFHFQPQEEEFEVEEIIKNIGDQYLVKWKGYPKSDNTWEPREHLEDCQALDVYEKSEYIPSGPRNATTGIAGHQQVRNVQETRIGPEVIKNPILRRPSRRLKEKT